ncbi:MCP methyltransferase, CheR-type [Sphingomonas sp. YR710]|jgi:chemotaxis protein methyltransferase CheR|uniref:CheR family methyltransferase n=1 Tax=Sphingomonas sp. YR710 TaxID=1882773 RepID=UPI000889869C|nr:protein-glutamate O-methyltransferase CheR [Sphingomonas sp. YR710]SDC29011.1 MCP methyltransferase, CheR-type [Sphingomonas sp. YR710]
MNVRSPPAQPDWPALSGDELRRLTDFLYQKTGMIFGENKRYYIERRVNQRIAETGASGFRSYFPHLVAEPAEHEALINAFTINETYFYREEHQLAALSRDILPSLTQGRKPGDLIRIWSMPCSSGEEPYSIAIWLLENWPLVDAFHIEIVGSDIDTAAILQAGAGIYGERSLSRLPADIVDRYFEPKQGHTRKIIDDIRESVHFVPVNLVEKDAMIRMGRFDVIFCRNLLIYFDDASRLAAAGHLFDSLNPGGYLCLGHTESMARISDRFAMARFDDAIVYRRP